MDFADAFNIAYIIKHDLESIKKLQNLLLMMKDSHFSLHVLTRAAFTTGNRIMIELQTVKDAYQSVGDDRLFLHRISRYNRRNVKK